MAGLGVRAAVLAAAVLGLAGVGLGAEPIKLVRKSPCNTAAASADGKFYAIGGTGAVVFDHTGKELKTINDKVWELVFTPDGKFLVGGGSGEDPTTRIYDTGTWECKTTIPDSGNFVVVSGDSARLLTMGQTKNSNDKALCVFEMAGGKEVARFELPKDESVSGQAISKDGKVVAAVLTKAAQLKVWDVEKKKEVFSVAVQNGWDRVALTADGKFVLECGTALAAWNVATKAPVKLALPEVGFGGSMLSDGKTFATFVQSKNAVVLQDVATGRITRTLPTKLTVAYTMTLSADGKALAVLGGVGFTAKVGTVEVFEVAAGKARGVIETPKLNQSILFLGKDASQVGVFGYYNTGGTWLYEGPKAVRVGPTG